MNTFDAKAKRANYLSALKTLDAGPREIEQARTQYENDIVHIRELESKGTWAPVAVQRMKDQAKDKRDSAIKKTVEQMRPALETVKAHKNGGGETLNIHDTKLQDVIRTVDALKSSLSYEAQISIIESFRGDAPALNFISDLFRRNRLYAADYAKSLTKEVSSQALDDMETALAYYDYDGNFDASKIFWSKGEFGKVLERNVIDPGADPFVSALIEMKSLSRDDVDAQQRFGSALSNIRKEQAEGNDIDTGAVLNEVLAAMEADN